MSNPPFSPDMTVAEALAAGRGVFKVFTAHHTACVGCYLVRFCALRDVAKAYGLTLDAFLAELRQAALADSSTVTGALNEKPD